MKNYLLRIKKIKRQFAIPVGENFTVAPSGTNYKVFLSDNYVIRFRDDNPKLLLREANFLKRLNYQLIPKVLWYGKIDELFFMVENRLPGQTMDLTWKNLSSSSKSDIIKQVVEFLQYQRIIIKDNIYSVKTGKKYKRFLDYLTDGVKQKSIDIKKFEQANKLLRDLFLIINNPEIKNLFTTKIKFTLVHGDLIIHNLLTDGKNLTGVLDWELALFGDPNYDLSRLFYYQECAKAYQEQGVDETFEADYMDKLIAAIWESTLVEDKKLFQKKYQFVYAIFYLNALHWAVSSNNPQKNIYELVVQWDKKKWG
ncbi:MAG: aminoglycoside phosphotransferase family protein [Patescibacteria group bacterium]|nr:aminoglycoside phosphotransferase family protein [Patescibacteria group bacterium]